MKDTLFILIGNLLYKYRYAIHNIKNRMANLVLSHECPNHRELVVEHPVIIHGGRYMTIGNNFHAFSDLRLECINEWYGDHYSPKLIIGNNVTLHYRCHIGCINRIEIGDDVLIGSNVLITDHAHGELKEESKDIPWIKRPLFSKGPVVIESNVWIGENVSILPNVTIGKGSVIGANSVVTHDIPSYCLAAGSPAVVLKQLRY